MQSSVSRNGQSNSLARYAAVIGLAALAGGIAGGLSVMLGDVEGALGLAATIVVVGLAMAIGLGGCVWWWRRVDEAAREAHKWAWWWGGTSGMAVGGVILLTVMMRSALGAPALTAGMTPAYVLYAGAMGMVSCQLAGYGIAWAAWWLRRR